MDDLAARHAQERTELLQRHAREHAELDERLVRRNGGAHRFDEEEIANGRGAEVERRLAYALPCRRFANALASARLGADVVRYSFIVVDFSPGAVQPRRPVEAISDLQYDLSRSD